MKNNYRIGLVLVIATAAIWSCKPKKTVASTAPEAPAEEVAPKVVSASCAGKEYTYESDVKAILDNNCAKTCHSSLRRAGGINLSNYDQAKEEAVKTRFMKALRHEGTYTPMPKKSPKLSDSTLNILSCWIENGCK